jgi:hypothetical protein
MIKLMVLTTAWLTALSAAMQAAAQISLTAEPPVGRHEVQGVVVENEGKYQSTGYTPADLLFLLCEPDEIPGYTVVVREYRGREIDGGTFAWMAPFGHTYVWLNVRGAFFLRQARGVAVSGNPTVVSSRTCAGISRTPNRLVH